MEFKSLMDIICLKLSDTAENCNLFFALEHLRFCDALGVTKQFLRFTYDQLYRRYVTVMQFAERLAGRAAANAVGSRMDWKYTLGLEITDPGRLCRPAPFSLRLSACFCAMIFLFALRFYSIF